MACSVTLNSILLPCESNIGGITKAWIWDKTLAPVSATPNGQDPTVTNYFQVTSADDIDIANIKIFEFRKATGSMTSTYNIDDATGSRYVSTDVSLQFSQLKADSNITIDELVKGNLAMVVKTASGAYYGLGVENPVTVTEAVMQTGTAYTDLSGYTVTLQDVSSKLPLTLSPDQVNVFEGLAEEGN